MASLTQGWHSIRGRTQHIKLFLKNRSYLNKIAKKVIFTERLKITLEDLTSVIYL